MNLPPHLPARIGPYRVLGALGQGGAGIVVRARAPDGREVAVKILSQVDPRRQERFAREQRLLSELSPAGGVVPLLDLGQDGSRAY